MSFEGGEIRHTIGAGGTLTLHNVAGRVRLAGADGGEVVVHCRTESGDTPRLNVQRFKGGLSVEPHRTSRSFLNLRMIVDFDAALDFDVKVPSGARVDVKTVSADIDGRDLQGEQNYKTVSGALSLDAVAGRISARSVSGDVSVRRGGQVELDATTTSGDVEVEAELIDQLHVRSVSGDVEVAVEQLRAGPRHSVETVSGDLRLSSDAGVTVEPARALDIGRQGRRRPIVVGDGAAQLVFRSMSGEEHVRGGRIESTGSDDWPFARDRGPGRHARHRRHAGHRGPARAAGGESEPMSPAAAASEGPATDQPPADDDRLAVLRALERGEIDVEEAARRLAEVSADA